MPQQLILVAYHYPPENAVGAARPARFTKYLPECGWRPEVITAAKQAAGGARVHHLPDLTRAHWEGHREDPGSPAGQRLGELLVRRFFFRGAIGLGWSAKLPRFVKEVLPRMDTAPRVVMSSFPPLAAHLAGWRLARRLRLPWVADFRDPFAPAVASGVSRFAAGAASILDSWFFRDAAAVIVNTEAVASLYRERYPEHAGKIAVIWNGFDPDVPLGPLPVPPRRRRVLSHVGALYDGRNPVAVIESFERMLAAGHKEVPGWEIVLVGPNDCSPEERRHIERGLAGGFVRMEPRKIPQADALRISQQSDGLLLLQPQSAVQVPGKLFDYIRIGRPILSLAPKDSQIEWLLDRCGIPHVDVYPDDAPGEIDRKVTEYLQLPSDPVSPSEWFVDNFNASRQAAQLAEILDRVTNAGKG